MNFVQALLPISWITVLVASFGSLLVYEVLWIIYCRTLHPLAHIPGPFLASFSRVWIWKYVGKGSLDKIELELHQKHGPLVRIAPNELSCSDPEAIKEIYRSRNPLEKSDFYSTWTNTALSKYDNHFAITNEKRHGERRRIVSHIYSLSNVLKSEQYIDGCSKLLIEKFGKFADDGRVVDLGNWLHMYAFDVVGELYFGKMFGFMEHESDYQNLIASLDLLNPVMARVAVSASYARLFILVSAIASSSIRSALKGIDHITKASKDSVIQRQEYLRTSEKAAKTERQDIMQQLFGIMHEKGAALDFMIPELQTEAYGAFFAGSDTTAIAMRSVFYYLTHHTDILSQLLEEIDGAFPVDQYPLNEPISYADAIKLPLLCATIKEAMRIHTSTAFTMPRVSPYPEGLNIAGKHIAPGYRIGMNPMVVHKDTIVFGEDAATFNPRRWLPENTSVEQLQMMERSMLHFGGGTRTCLGKNISLAEMHKAIPQILRNFHLIPTDPAFQWTVKNYWFNKQTGMPFQLKRRTF